MKTFEELGLNAHILKSLKEIGYVEATPIQEQAIPFVLENDQDLIGLAQTGTGKTAAFGLPILNKLTKNKDLQAIILCPTRELCLQISREISTFAKYSAGVSVATVYGGARIDLQIQELRAGANIVVGTPGRVHDLIRRRILNLHTIRFVVLDEADEMLDLGFKDDLDAILAETPATKRTLLFSATMSSTIYGMAKQYMNEPKEISVSKKNIGADKVVHQYYLVKPGQKYEALRRVVDSEPDIYGILFCRTRNETQEIADKLKEDRYSTEALHGDISQNLRTQIMERFRQRKIQLLVATDVAARGIDVNDLTHVINYSLPDVSEVYVHRSGRTGRAQKSGVSLSILTMRELRKVRDLEYKTGKTFELKRVPTGQEICEKQLLSLVEKMVSAEVSEKEIAPFLPAVEERLKGLSRHDLLARFVSAEFNHFLNLYKDTKDMEAVATGKQTGGERGSMRERSDRQPEENFINVRINIGKKDRLEVKTLFGLINAQKELKGAEIGKIRMFDTFTIFGIDKNREKDIDRSFKSSHYNGRKLEAKIADGFKAEGPSRKFSDKDRGRPASRKKDVRPGRYKGRR
ncbi:DEAD/DEAH box helicase [Candidatus Falkowbacteria bacterium]|nr:DEAD/DEAH box helicase [Candidatus Falkowbacteria bacterium]